MTLFFRLNNIMIKRGYHMELILSPKPMSLKIKKGAYILNPSCNISAANYGFMKAVMTAKKSFLKNASVYIGDINAKTAVRVYEEKNFEKEEYSLFISEKGIEIHASSPQAVFYAFMTLKQIIMQTGNELPYLEINDKPHFKIRGYMFDISRNKVPTLKTLKEKADLLAFFKINHLELYIEGTPYKSATFTDMWTGYDALSCEDIIEFDQYCKERYIELVPNQNMFGHMGEWIFNGYRSLAEYPESACPTCLDPFNPDSLKLAENISDDLIKYFTSDKYNVGLDETWDLGKGKSKEICEKTGIGKVYFDYLMKIYEYCKESGKTMMFWADMLNKYPQFIKDLPKDVIVMNWGYYNDLPTEQSCIDYEENNLSFCVCPGTAAWNTVIGNVTQMLENTKSTILKGYKHNAVGVVNTEWGDNGHLQGSTTAYPGLIYAASMSWQPEENKDICLEDIMDTLVFEDKKKVIGNFIMKAGKFSDYETKKQENTSYSFVIFKSDIKDHEKFAELKHEELGKVTDYLNSIKDIAFTAELKCSDAQMITTEYLLDINILLTAQKMGRYHLYCLEGNKEKEERLAKEIYFELLDERKTLRDMWLIKNTYSKLDIALKPIDANIDFLHKYIDIV